MTVNYRQMRLFRLILTVMFSLGFFVANAQLLHAGYAPLEADVALETALLQATNQARTANGLNLLQYDDQLALAARHHALEMATLNYFSHQSPTPGSSTPPERAANGGSPYVFIGENIAKMPPGDLAQSTTDGWMGSPGHRENLLKPEFSHVGFGTAQDTQGYTYVVQMFALEPFILRSAQVTTKKQGTYLISMDVSLPQPSTVAFGYGIQVSEPMQLQAGTNRVELTTTEANQIYLQGAVPSPAENGYILQDGGWLTLASGNYQADQVAPKTYLQILGATSQLQNSVVSEVTLVFDGAVNKKLGVFVNDVFQPEAMIASGTIRVNVSSQENAKIAVGEIHDGNQVNIYLIINVNTSQGEPILMAVAD
jgi:Cysteine-rich secretory protein family